MHAILRSTSARLWLAAFGSALLAAFLVTVNPFPSDVYGQQPVPGSSIQGTVTQNPIEVLGARSPSVGAVAAVQARPALSQQQPTSLPRTGVGLTADTDANSGLIYGLLALAAGLGATGLVARVRHRR